MSFNEKVYAACKSIPKGRISTYKEIAHSINTKAYRAVGNALNRNPFSFSCNGDVPCHRVVQSNGNVGGFADGSKKKIELLEKERIKIKDDKIVEFEKHFTKL